MSITLLLSEVTLGRMVIFVPVVTVPGLSELVVPTLLVYGHTTLWRYVDCVETDKGTAAMFVVIILLVLTFVTFYLLR